MKPIISAIIPVLGPQPLLKRAVFSVLQQPDIDELIVVDDGSTEPIVLESHEKLRIVRLDNNSGIAAARNTGVAAARGELLAFLDSDDLWLEGKISKQIDMLNQVGDDIAGSICGFQFLRSGKKVVHQTGKRFFTFEDALSGPRIALGSCLLVKAKVFRDIGGFDASARRCEDWEFLLRLVNNRELVSVNETLVELDHGYRTKADVGISAMHSLERKVGEKNLSFRQLRIFKGAMALEKASIYLNNGFVIKALGQLALAFANRPVWLSTSVANRLLFGAVPGI